MKETVMFRFVPTMRCNFRCEYCFEPNNQKKYASTMFDTKTVEEWVDGIQKFTDYNIELYFWGGEPFCIDGTYHFIKRCSEMDHIISGFRIDTNVFFAEKIATLCPSNKVKLNCSYHMQYHSLEEEFRKVKLLKNLDMVGMINFVASPYNLEHLKNEYGMTVNDLIKKFAEIDVFVNIAGDFAYANNPDYERYDEYKNFIMQFISPEEWMWLRGVDKERKCDAGRKMFTVDYNGNFLSCISDKKYGNLFNGILKPDEHSQICKKRCLSLVSYPFRLDNNFPTVNSLLAYVERNKEYREGVNEKFVDFSFD